jgi:predicted membrane protein
MGSVFCNSVALWGAKVRACRLFAISLLFRWCFSAISLVFLCYFVAVSSVFLCRFFGVSLLFLRYSFGIARGLIRFFFAISLSFYWCFIGVSLLSKQRKGRQKVNNMQSNMYSVHRHKLCRMYEKANRFLAECH